MEAFPLRIQERVQHLPPCTTIQHKGQSHYRRNWYEDGIHCQMLWVNSEYSQKSNSSNNAAKDKKEDDERWETTRFFPFIFTCNTTNGFNVSSIQKSSIVTVTAYDKSDVQFMFSCTASIPSSSPTYTQRGEGGPTLRIFSLEYSEKPGCQKAKLSFTSIREGGNHFSHWCFSTYTGQPIVICKQKPWGKGKENVTQLSKETISTYVISII